MSLTRLLFFCLPAAALAQGVSGTYKNCDPNIHDQLIGAEFRSPSDCEIKFDNDLRAALNRAFAPLVTALTAKNWIRDAGPHKELTGLARSMQKAPYQPAFTNRGGFGITLKMDPRSEEAQRKGKEFQDLLQSASAQSLATPAARARFAEQMQQFQLSTNLHIAVAVNLLMGGQVNFAATHQPLDVPGALFAVRLPKAQANTGGGEDAASPAALVYFGAWTKLAIEKLKDGERLTTNNTFNRALPVLAVQNLRVTIHANQQLLDQVLKLTDWSVLQSLIAK